MLADQIEDSFGYIHESVLELKESGLSIEIEEIESLVLSLDTLFLPSTILRMLWQPSTEEIATWNRTLVKIEDQIFLLLGYIPESVLKEWNSGGTESGLEVGCYGGNSIEVEEIESLISSLDELSILVDDFGHGFEHHPG